MRTSLSLTPSAFAKALLAVVLSFVAVILSGGLYVQQTGMEMAKITATMRWQADINDTEFDVGVEGNEL